MSACDGLNRRQRSPRRSALLLVLGLLGLSGCATAPHSVGCPSLEEWSPEDLGALADQLDAVPEHSPIDRLQADWQRMRDGIRACQS